MSTNPDIPVPEALIRLDRNSLVGMTAEEARGVVEAHGGDFYPSDDGFVTFVHNPRRVVAYIQDGRVSSTAATLG